MGDIEEGWTLTKPPHQYVTWSEEEGVWIDDEVAISLHEAQVSQSEMISELDWVDLQLKYHASGDTKRSVSTVDLLNQYAIACRDYVQNIDGILTIVGEKPVRPE